MTKVLVARFNMASLSLVRPSSGDMLKNAQPGTSLGGKTSSHVIEETTNVAAPTRNTKSGDVDFSDPTAMYDYVLYYHEDSKPAMSIYDQVVNISHLRKKVWLQNIRELHRDELSESPWCNGVPILVNKRTGDAFRGKKASACALEIIPEQNIPLAKSTANHNVVNPAFGLTANTYM